MRQRLRHAVDWRLRAVVGRLDHLSEQVARLQATVDEQRRPPVHEPASEAASARRHDALLTQGQRLQATLDEHVEPLLRTLAADEATTRRRLHALRDDPAYERAWSRPDPLVSVTIATRDRPELLVRRALPSLLAQTHEHLEVVVVGDAAGPEVAEAVAALGDPRVHWSDLTQHVELHPDPARHWLVGSALARNEAGRLARGAWLLHFDDDDALHPDAIELLLARARETHAEVAYGGFTRHAPDGGSSVHLAFPPQRGEFGWQGALHHAGLPFERELVAAHLGLPGDVWLVQRMLRAGVRFAMVDRPVWDYFPSRIWRPDAGA